jgi:hypothetical protein
MKASEALRHGDTLRPAVGALGERFCYVEGRGLCSDAWGAIVEAAMPTVVDFHWDKHNAYKFERSMDAFRALQLEYFASYFQMPVRCPGSRQLITKVGGRLVKRFGRPDELKTYDDHARVFNQGGITTECDKVEHLAGMIDHLFYKHRWTRADIAAVVEWYENTNSQAAINRSFTHYAANWR